MNTPVKETIEISKFHTWMGDDGIVHTRVKPDSEIFLKDAKENTDAVASFYKDKKLLLMVDIRQIRSISHDARAHFSLQRRDSTVKAFALLLSSAASRLIGNFFISFNNPAVPVRLFTEEVKAIEWLNKYRD